MSVTHRMESQRGRIGKEINRGLDKNNKPWANFSLAVDVNRQNEQGTWEKVDTNWYQVAVFGAQAKNVADSFSPGDPVVVSGNVEQAIRVVEGPDGTPVAQTRNEVKASMVGPDLILTPVTLPESPARSGPTRSGPGTTAQQEQAPANDVASRHGYGHGGSGAEQPRAASAGPETDQASAARGAAAIWPPAAQPGSGSVGLR
ncbi:MAG: single-stranded DNA-binding protein [Brachybacterium sp.]|nr:single-stranded DNA-binding protein [Brachybacterium sp.]